ncbi:hypothetical protein BGZ76_004168 [Entomortierella beljakovae]|nr:hypothetical protein BGZ76_004168 [Entomortierella beljakovae]
MREYLVSRKATQRMSSMSCKDIFLSQPKENPGDDNINSFVCAAKCLNPNPDSQSTGLSEAKILKRLNTHDAHHPGRPFLVDYLGLYDQTSGQAISPMDGLAHEMASESESHDSKWAILLEYCQNGSIWDWIRQNPEKVGLRQWLAWAIQLVQAVDYIHEAGLVHHDIKPHNILLDESHDAKLSDFGAGIFQSKTRQDGATLSLDEGYGRGTPPYSAPEMFASAADARYTQAIDIYSLGVSLYVIGLTAQEPFHRVKNPMEMIIWIKKGGFWLMEDQSWVHDRGPVPKVTSSSSRLSTSSTALSALGHHHHLHNRQESKLKSRPSSSNLLTPNLPPINTNLGFDHSVITPNSANSPGLLGSSNQDLPHLKESPVLLPVGSSNHQFTAGYSPERSLRSNLPSTPVSPLPLPSPIVRSHTPRSRGEDSPRKSGEIIMRFLNGEVVEYQVIQLLKDMCHMDPNQRPSAKSILQRLHMMQEQLNAEMEAEAEEMNYSMDIDVSSESNIY